MHKPDAASWRSTTHDWATELDVEHLDRIRREPAVFAPAGALHLVLEVLAYAAGEAQGGRPGKAIVTLCPDGSVSIEDNGRGTAIRLDSEGRVLKKPVIATKDLRFFDFPEVAVLPDGHPRRGMSVVAALSEWLVHVNRRRNGAWTQRYAHGLPATDLTPIPDNGATGTMVHFLSDPALLSDVHVRAHELDRLAAAFGPDLPVEIAEHP